MRTLIMLFLMAGWQMTARPGVVITGILDGTLSGGCPKVIEIFVSGTENLNYFEIWRSLNGAPFGSGSGSISSLSGVYTNTFVYLVKTDQVNVFIDVFGNEGIFANVLPLGIINGNGNDGFQIRRKVGSVVIDQVWLEDDTDSYLDSYWYRKHGTGPDGGWFPSAWETPGNDALDGLDIAGLQASVPFGTYSMAWKGLTNDWNNPDNWSLGIVPSFQANVLIRDTAQNFPLVGNLPATPAVCMNLTVTDTAKLIVGVGKALTVHGNLVLSGSVPGTPERGLILESDSSQAPSGSLILKGNASGTLFMKRYLGKDNGWHFISPPVDSQAFAPEFVPEPVNNSFDLYFWSEDSLESRGWINCRNEDGSWNETFGDRFIPGSGYLVAYSSSNPGEAVRTFSGTPAAGDRDIPLGHSGNYWNLAGNPYSCALDWSSDGIDKGNIAGSAMYIWDPALNDNLGGYRTHNGSLGVPSGTTSIIPSMQAFFVQTSGPGNLSVDISNDEPLVHHSQDFYKAEDKEPLAKIRAKIKRGSFTDETLICFDPAATAHYDPSLDADKLFHFMAGCPEIYSVAEPGHFLCINSMKDFSESVTLGISCQEPDSLELIFYDFEEIPPETDLFLEDRLFSQWIHLRENPVVKFYFDPSMPDDRFVLHFMNPVASGEPVSMTGLEFWNASGMLYLNNYDNVSGTIKLFSVDGKLQRNFPVSSGKSVIPLELPAGIYAIQVLTDRYAWGKKIIIY